MTALQRIIKYCAVAFAIFLVVAIVGGICGALGLLAGLSGNEAAGETRLFPVNGPVDSLDLEISAAELSIVSGEGFSVESNHKYLDVELEEGTLKLREKKVAFGVSPGGVKVVLTVPEGFVFDEAELETGAGKVDIAELRADILRLDLGAGATEIGRLEAYSRARINTGAGKLTIRGGEMRDLSMDMGVGKLELTGRLTGSSRVDLGVGGADITLLGSRDDYRISLDKGLGGAELDGTEMDDGGSYGSGRNSLDLDGGVGSIRISFGNLRG